MSGDEMVVLVCRSPNTDDALVAGGNRPDVMESFAGLVRSGHFAPHTGRRAAVMSVSEWARHEPGAVTQ